MARLEDLRIGAMVGGIAPDRPVELVAVEWIGEQAVNLAFRGPGGVGETTLYRDDEYRLSIERDGGLRSLDADGDLLRLAIEANRIERACHFDPYLAIHTSLVEPLPHQITAVYGEMIPRQPLRFLLADDPGAGKTIMAGLLIKELIARSDIERCLIVAPGSLVEQWQDELGDKFGLEFDLFSRATTETSRSGNPFDDSNFLIVRLDVLARNDDLQAKLLCAQEWDLIVCDEAHRMSASYFGDEAKYTKRYRTGRKLGRICRHLLLMSATPHNGREEDFQLFMALLDGDRFEGRVRDSAHSDVATDMMRRLTKEELRRFDGRPLFPERRAYTVKYALSPSETALYNAVTEYVRNEMNRVQRFAETDGKKRNNVGFALQILQRRLASSPAAIHRSLMRRRERLERELDDARSGARPDALDLRSRFAAPASAPAALIDEDDLENADEYGQEEIDDSEDLVSATATMAETVEQLELEVGTLRNLERMAFRVLQAGEDTKWRQLGRILDDERTIDGQGDRRKLIIFTESRDTLAYLMDRIRSRLGRAEAVDAIHGGVNRRDRRKIIERFMQDKSLLVLVANDAAGEGVNLQRGHLMVNYDLPWNPNRIEQRFGRIHRIGQTEICHLWNLVAADTREGEVYARLLDKLDIARAALGGRVYDVLGELFSGAALKDLLCEAIQYGERQDVKARLLQQVDRAADRSNLVKLLQRRALATDTLPEAQVQALRREMERAAAQRLQPHHIQSFFVEAFQRLGGRLKPREAGRFELLHVPLRIREWDRTTGVRTPIQKKYERICFDKTLIHRQPVAAFVCPGHPLLQAVIGLVLERYGGLMQQGAVMVDETDPGEEMSAIFLIDHAVQDGRTMRDGKPNIVSQKLQFVAIDRAGQATDAGIAPHLNLRSASREEIDALGPDLQADWLSRDLQNMAERFAVADLAQAHLDEVKARRLPEIEKIDREVEARLSKQINYWDSRAYDLKQQQKAGRKTRLGWENAQRRAEDLAERRKRRQEQLRQEKSIAAQPPYIRGAMIAAPKGLLAARMRVAEPETETGAAPAEFSENAASRREIELEAMQTVMAAECALGNRPEDVSAQKRGYDIESYDPNLGRSRFIEVKGRIDGAKTITVTRQEVIASLNAPEQFILAVVPVKNGFAAEPRYVRRPFTQEPEFGVTAIQVKLQTLLDRAEKPG